MMIINYFLLVKCTFLYYILLRLLFILCSYILVDHITFFEFNKIPSLFNELFKTLFRTYGSEAMYTQNKCEMLK